LPRGKVIMKPKLEIALALGVASLFIMWVIAIAPIAAQEGPRVPTAEGVWKQADETGKV